EEVDEPENSDESEGTPTNPVESDEHNDNEPPIVSDPTPETPITNEEGTIIVGVEDSNPIVQNPDGSTQPVSAETINATIQEDGSVTVKDEEGQLKVLPQTGEKENQIMTILGSLLTLI